MKNTSKYARRLARRRGFGKVRISLTRGPDLVTAKGERFPCPTLNRSQFRFQNGDVVFHTFERLARADEV